MQQIVDIVDSALTLVGGIVTLGVMVLGFVKGRELFMKLDDGPDPNDPNDIRNYDEPPDEQGRDSAEDIRHYTER